MINQFGYPQRDNVNVAGDLIINPYPDLGDDDTGDDSDASESRSSGGGAETSGAGLIVLVAIAGVLYLIFGGDDPFPTVSDPWPPGVEREDVTAATASWFDKCEASISASPANCPQSIDETSDDVSSVHWAFYGKPVDGVSIQFTKSKNTFDVLGTVVVSADYTDSKQTRRVVTPMTYWAEVHYVDGQLDVQEIKKHSAVGDPAVTKQDPKQAWEFTAAKLKDAFTLCVRGARLAMPAGCPDWSPPLDSKKVKWSLDGDPLLTARSSFDPKYGLVHVTGTYGVTVRYSLDGAAQSESRAPNYEAWIAPTETGPVVLQVKDAI